MSSVKKEARLSGILLARKGTAMPAHTDHRLTVQAADQFVYPQEEKNLPKELSDIGADSFEIDDDGNFIVAVNEVKNIHNKQTKGTIVESGSDAVEADMKTAAPRKKSSDQKNNASAGQKKGPENKRIAMTLRMEQDDHLKLRLYAAHSRKSCQEIISEALNMYMSKNGKVCAMEECNCLSS